MDLLGNLQIEWFRLLLGSLHGAGVRDVVVSPGSRSTPIVLAAADTPGIVLHDVIDERAAAFFALGQARVTGRPSVALCTSGSAAGHYLPAAMEAGAAGVPLILLTADRPFELQDCGASQTLDQVKLYGAHVRRSFDLGHPDADAAALRSVRRVAAQAVLASRWPAPGAVHINARARKPLEPQPARTPAEHALQGQVAALLSQPVQAFAAALAPDPAGVAELSRRCAAARRGLIVCGPAPLSQVAARPAIFALARAAGFPVLCEAASQLRFHGIGSAQRSEAPSIGSAQRSEAPSIDLADDRLVLVDGFEALLRAPAAALEPLAPDFVLQIGAAPTSGAWEAYLDRLAVPRAVIAPLGWPDPAGSADLLLLADVGQAARLVADRLGEARGGSVWLDLWRSANGRAQAAVAAALEQDRPGAELPGGPTASEAQVVRAAVEATPPGGLLILGNSLPIREVDLYCPAGLCQAHVLSQRGASGIDGLIAGAAGAASVFDGPVTLLLGDVSALHDLSGLMLAHVQRRSLAVVVVHNGGGRIFQMLPLSQAGLAPAALDHFVTPHDLDFTAAARLYGVGAVRADGPAAVQQAVRAAHARGEAVLIEARVAPGSAVGLLRRLGATVAAALPDASSRQSEEAPR